jgi:ECF transporter S component (folate family)
MHKFNTRTVVYLGVLTALEIILSRFLSFSVWNMKIGFSFVPIVLAAILFGPVSAAIVGGLGDFLGAVLFPIGPYFPGFTLTAVLTGLVFGLFLHKEQNTLRVISAVVIQQLLLSLLMNTYWLSVLYTSPFLPLLSTRLVQCAILGPVQIVTILLLLQPVKLLEKRIAP